MLKISYMKIFVKFIVSFHFRCHLYENQNCGSPVDVCSQTAVGSARQNRKADKKDGFSQT